jgi:hypothetical protein
MSVFGAPAAHFKQSFPRGSTILTSNARPVGAVSPAAPRGGCRCGWQCAGMMLMMAIQAWVPMVVCVPGPRDDGVS